MNRIRLLLFATFVVAVTAFSWGSSATYAQQGTATEKPATEKDPAAAKRDADAAVKARAKRDAVIKNRHATKDYIKKVVEGQQPGAAATAPDNTGKEGGK